MTARLILALLVAAATLLSYGCGGSRLATPPVAPENRADASAPPALAGIPGLDALPAASKELSLLGPGWLELDPQATIAADNTALGPGAALTFNAAAGMAYAVYGISGFDGDNGPTSARITQSNVTGQFFIGFSDYVAGTWRFAGPFTGDATTDIPLPTGGDSSEYLSASAFTSPDGTCYVVIAVPDGGVLTMTGLELGVQGGVKAPHWTIFEGIDGGDAGCLVTWRPSISAQDPDFMGYMLERAPLLYGDFAPLEPDAIEGTAYLDTTAEMDVAYRYRLAAVDASGNLSLWFQGTGQATTGALTSPVPVLKVPRGPLHSPAQVTLDLSESYDPAGVGITDYEFSFLLYPRTVNGPSPTQTLTLPPGCHVITATVTTADARTRSTTALLKVYPSWQDTPAVVAPTSAAGTTARLNSVRGMLHPDTERPVLFGVDHSSYGCAFWYENEAGVLLPSRLPLINPAYNPSEPVSAHGKVFVSIATNNGFQIAALDNGVAIWQPNPFPAPAFTVSALTVDPGENVRMFAAQDHGGVIDVTLLDPANPGGYQVIAAGVAGVISIDALYDLDSDCYDVVYSTPASTEWARYDPATMMVTASSTLLVGPSGRIDLERNPVTGRPALAYYNLGTSRWTYTELDAALAWIAHEIVDNSAVNSMQGDLAFGNNGDAFMYFATAPGQSNLHERTAVATWAPRNTPAFAAASGADALLVNFPNTDDFLTGDRIGGHVLIARQTPDPAEDLLYDMDPYLAQHGNIQGAAGTVDATEFGDEVLHVFVSDNPGASGKHYVSDTGGGSWTAEASTGYFDFDVAATLDGGVYITNHVPANHELYYWDPVGEVFALYGTAPIAGTTYSFLSGGILDQDVDWYAYDGAGNMTYTTGHWGLVVVPTVSPVQVTPVWTGAGDTSGYSATYAVLAGGADINFGKMYWGAGTTGDLNLGSDSFIAELATVYDEAAVRMKQCAATAFLESSDFFTTLLPATAIWSTYGIYADAQRVSISLTSTTTSEPVPMTLELSNEELRRTVTAASGAGMTGIGLVSKFDGSEAYFEWSNFGDWEQLPLPEALNQAINPELIIGRDGSWHIVYYDYFTDRVLCLNSL